MASRLYAVDCNPAGHGNNVKLGTESDYKTHIITTSAVITF